MYRWLRTVLFRMSPERAHHLVMGTLSIAPGAARLVTPPIKAHSSLQQQIWNQKFAHPIGLAAGLDKNGVAVDGLLHCGFSFVEVGTVTPQPQPGNPQPRLFRLVEDKALINRMGFNNDGAQALRQRLLKRRMPGVIGVNIGKNKITPNEHAVDDYVSLVHALYSVASYITVNVSSPNTPGLRDLQSEAALLPLIRAIIAARNEEFEARRDKVRPHWVPILVKLAPDLPDDALQQLATQLVECGVDGLIATNTTIRRDGLSSRHQEQAGGLSGLPLRERSTAVVSLLYQATNGRIPIIGSGGVFNAADAYEKIRAGASLVQIYTGFIYEGPRIVHDVVEDLAKLLTRDGFASVSEAIGVDAR